MDNESNSTFEALDDESDTVMFSKKEVLDLLKTFDNNMMAANSIMEQLTGRVFSDISSTDFEELQTTQELLRLIDM